MTGKCKIYCLKNSQTGAPFYVGATQESLEKRLSGHLTQSRNGKTEKDLYIRKLGMFRPLISLLAEVDLKEVDKYEMFFFDKFLTEGNRMMQDSRKFNYQTTCAKRIVEHKKEIVTAQVKITTARALRERAENERKSLSFLVDEILTNFIHDQFDAR